MEQRRTRRFQLELPLAITRTGTERAVHPGVTKNISSMGVLFTTGAQPDLGGPIEYVITLKYEGTQSVNLRCVGKVLRFERALGTSDNRRSYQIAATLERYEFVRELGIQSAHQ
jgi:hypothetical protein